MKAPLSLGMESLKYAMGKPHEHQYGDGRCLVCQELEPEFEQSFCAWIDEHEAEVMEREEEKAICTLCAAVESDGFYTGCMIADGHCKGTRWSCDGKGNLTPLHPPRSFSEWLDEHNDYLSESPDPHYAPENNAEID